ncbi:unnamed protein product, partial [Ectocarpus sp. 12 AP-2014]
IIAITLGTVTTQTFGMQFMVLTVVAIMITVGVYGLVAGIVKLDDAGLYLSRTGSAVARKLGESILWLAPWMMKTLSVLGTIAMFLVGGGILTHGLPPVYDAIHHFAEGFSGITAMLIPTLADGAFGLVVGALLMALVTPLLAWWQDRSA